MQSIVNGFDKAVAWVMANPRTTIVLAVVALILVAML